MTYLRLLRKLQREFKLIILKRGMRHERSEILPEFLSTASASSARYRRCSSADSPNTWGAASTRASTTRAHRTRMKTACATDVLAALRELNFRSMRYPGGNFVSGYRWEDGIGPKDQRPARRELAWQSIESNHFGTDEFIRFCREIDSEPMLAVNLGTGTIQDAANLVEYCNAPAGTSICQYARGERQRSPIWRQVLVPGQRDGRTVADRPP